MSVLMWFGNGSSLSSFSLSLDTSAASYHMCFLYSIASLSSISPMKTWYGLVLGVDLNRPMLLLGTHGIVSLYHYWFQYMLQCCDLVDNNVQSGFGWLLEDCLTHCCGDSRYMWGSLTYLTLCMMMECTIRILYLILHLIVPPPLTLTIPLYNFNYWFLIGLRGPMNWLVLFDMRMEAWLSNTTKNDLKSTLKVFDLSTDPTSLSSNEAELTYFYIYFYVPLVYNSRKL